MIKKLQEEWEKLSPEARAALEKDPSLRQSILDRMGAMASALQKMSQSSVTRVSLSQAVRDSLREILAAEGIPGLAELRGELASVRKMAEQASARPAAAGEVPELKERLGREIADLRSSLAGLAARGEAPGLLERIAGIERLAAQASAQAEARAARVESQLAETGKRVLDLAERVSALQAEAGRPAPEAAEVTDASRRLLEAQAKEFLERAAALAERLDEHTARLKALGDDLNSADDHLAAGLKDLESRLGGRIAELESSSAARIEGVAGNLERSLAASETRLLEAQGLIEARISATAGDKIVVGMKDLEERLLRKISELEASARARIDGAERAAGENLAAAQARQSGEALRLEERLAGRIAKLEEALPELRAMEGRLRTQMDIAMDQLSDKVNALVEMVGQIQAGVPPRQVYEEIGERLERLENRFRSVSDQLEGIEGTLPELKALGDRVAGLRVEVTALAGDVSASEKEFHDAWGSFSRKVQDVQDLLRANLERWNADRSNVRQRIVDLRDALHDQLQTLARHAESGGGFWGKVLGKPEGVPRISPEEWDRLRTRLETVVQGLESLLADSK